MMTSHKTVICILQYGTAITLFHTAFPFEIMTMAETLPSYNKYQFLASCDHQFSAVRGHKDGNETVDQTASNLQLHI